MGAAGYDRGPGFHVLEVGDSSLTLAPLFGHLLSLACPDVVVVFVFRILTLASGYEFLLGP